MFLDGTGRSGSCGDEVLMARRGIAQLELLLSVSLEVSICRGRLVALEEGLFDPGACDPMSERVFSSPMI